MDPTPPADPAASDGLLDRVRAVLVQAEATCAGTPAELRLREVRERLDEPLRLALAGKV